MHRPPRRKPKSPGAIREPPPPTLLTRSERLQLVGFVAAVAAILVGLTWYHVAKIERYDLDANLRYVTGEYHLDGEQVRRLRVLETEFHGRTKHLGFLTPGGGASEEHHRAMSRCMDPEQAWRFLAAEAERVR